MKSPRDRGGIALAICGFVGLLVILAIVLFVFNKVTPSGSPVQHTIASGQMTDAELIDALAENDMSIASAYRDELRRRGEGVAAMGLAHADYRVRQRCVQTLSRFSTETAHAHLVSALNDQDRYVRMAAINGLVLFWEDERSKQIVREHAKTEKDPVTLGLIERHGIK